MSIRRGAEGSPQRDRQHATDTTWSGMTNFARQSSQKFRTTSFAATGGSSAALRPKQTMGLHGASAAQRTVATPPCSPAHGSAQAPAPSEAAMETLTNTSHGQAMHTQLHGAHIVCVLASPHAQLALTYQRQVRAIKCAYNCIQIVPCPDPTSA